MSDLKATQVPLENKPQNLKKRTSRSEFLRRIINFSFLSLKITFKLKQVQRKLQSESKLFEIRSYNGWKNETT